VSARSDLTDPANERVLATLNADGSRRWLRPKLSPGRFLTARRVVAYALIALFTALPYITISGKPSILLDIVRREFTFFGATFLPTDTVLLAVLMLIVFLSVFLITAMAGRVWCGWGCPQTVYMEFLYRPLERLIEGRAGRTGKPVGAARKLLKFVVFFLCSCYLAHTFLAYFVGVEELARWVRSSPAQHPVAFIVMAAVTGLMMFDFAYFREQTCLVACPYGRLQAALLDRHSMIITYDRRRGEPRGKLHHHPAAAASPDVALPVIENQRSQGDCIDCFRCVTTCPTGIDIRDGLQMECIGCAQCIDACDDVMTRIGKPKGLIRYSSQAIVSGEARRLIRPRTILYPLILAGLVGFFVFLLSSREAGEAAVLPRQSTPFYALPDGQIANQVRLRLVNRGREPAVFTVVASEADAARGVRLVNERGEVCLQPGQSDVLGLVIEAPADGFSGRGAYEANIEVRADNGFTKTLRFKMLGPVGQKPAGSNAENGEAP